MSKALPSLLQHFLSLCEDDWVACRARAMFGGYGIYREDQIFAIFVDDKVYLKTDAATRPQFDAQQLEPFVFVSKDGVATAMSYCRLPEVAFDDPDELLYWLKLAWQVAMASAAQKQKKSVRKTALKKKTAKATPNKSAI